MSRAVVFKSVSGINCDMGQKPSPSSLSHRKPPAIFVAQFECPGSGSLGCPQVWCLDHTKVVGA